MTTRQLETLEPVPAYVVHWNAPDWCAEAVSDLQGSSLSVDVTVIDNSGTYCGSVAVLRPTANRGFAGGANIGLKRWLASDRPWCVIASHDVHVASDSIARMLEAGLPTRVGIVGAAMGRVVPGPAQWVSGTIMVLRRSCIEAIGLFDESFGSYLEDVDLCRRATSAGWQVVAVDCGVLGRGHVLDRAGRVATSTPNEILLHWKHRDLFALVRDIATDVALGLRHLVAAIHGDRRLHLRVSIGYLAAPARGLRKIVRGRQLRESHDTKSAVP